MWMPLAVAADTKPASVRRVGVDEFARLWQDKQNVVLAETIPANRLADTNLLNYQAIVLSNVRSLPEATAKAWL